MNYLMNRFIYGIDDHHMTRGVCPSSTYTWDDENKRADESFILFPSYKITTIHYDKHTTVHKSEENLVLKSGYKCKQTQNNNTIAAFYVVSSPAPSSSNFAMYMQKGQSLHLAGICYTI